MKQLFFSTMSYLLITQNIIAQNNVCSNTKLINTYSTTPSYDPSSSNNTSANNTNNNSTGRKPLLSNLVQAKDGNLYGMTYKGGLNDVGIIYKYDLKMNVFIEKSAFEDFIKGSSPMSSLIQGANHNLYGVTKGGGVHNKGVLFEYNTVTNNYSKKIDFTGADNGSGPSGALILATDGNLYGLTPYGGTGNMGVLFQYNPTTNNCVKKIDFTDITNGIFPYASLTQGRDGNLYGVTPFGGINNKGVLFQYNPTTNSYTKKIDFFSVLNGGNPWGSLIQASDGNFYGISSSGGTSNKGVIFQYNALSNKCIIKIDFTGTNGEEPFGALMQAKDGNLYGMTRSGGKYNKGALFQYNPFANSYTKKIDFDGELNGEAPLGSLLQASDGNLYGTTSAGGTNNTGVFFKYNPQTNTYFKIVDFNALNVK